MADRKRVEAVRIIYEDAEKEEAKGDYFLKQGESFTPEGKEHCRIAANSHYKLALDLYKSIGAKKGAARVAGKIGLVLRKKTA